MGKFRDNIVTISLFLGMILTIVIGLFLIKSKAEVDMDERHVRTVTLYSAGEQIRQWTGVCGIRLGDNGKIAIMIFDEDGEMQSQTTVFIGGGTLLLEDD